MPYPRVCYYCKRTFMTSTYGLLEHVRKCSQNPSTKLFERRSKDERESVDGIIRTCERDEINTRER